MINMPDQWEPTRGDEIDEPISWEPSRTFLRFAVFALLVGSGLMMVALRLISPDQPLRNLGPALMIGFALALAYLLYGNRIAGAVKMMTAGALVLVSLIAVFTGGVLSPLTVAYPLIILLSGWLISPRAAVLVTGLIVAATVGFIVAHFAGLLPVEFDTPPAVHGLEQIVAYILTAALIIALVNAYRNRLQDLHAASNKLALRGAELEISQAGLQRAQAVAKVGNWTYDFATDTMRMSDETARIFGLPSGATGSYASCLARVHPQDRDIAEDVWRAASKGNFVAHEYRIRVGDAVRWIYQKGELEYGLDGSLIGFIGTTQDITDRKQAELALRESEERYRTLVELTPQPVLVHRMGTLEYANAAALKLFGAPDAQALLGKATSELIHPDYRESQRERMLNIANGVGVAQMTQSRFLKLDGTAFDVQVQGTAIVYAGEPAIQVAINDISVLKAQEAKLEHIAHYDVLTDLPNRVLLADRLHQAMVQAQRRGQLLAVVYLDLDGFKAVNDRHGHACGDEMLVVLAQRLKLALREGDTLARLGGDEFVAILIDLAETAASFPLLARLLDAAAQPVRIGGFDLEVSASLGVTYYPQSPDVEADMLLRQADQAMYRAKLAGKNRYQVFAPE